MDKKNICDLCGQPFLFKGEMFCNKCYFALRIIEDKKRKAWIKQRDKILNAELEV